MAERGLLDLSLEELGNHKMIALDGIWEFYKDLLLTPEEFRDGNPKTIDYFNLPGIWRGQTENGIALSPKGVATYRLVIAHPDYSGTKGLYVKTILSACTIWVNGNKLGMTGLVGLNKKMESPDKHILLDSFDIKGKSTEIILQVSNFHNASGGVAAPILIGNYEELLLNSTKSLIITAVLAGMFLIIGFHHLVMYSMRREDKENLYFGLYCLVWSAGTAFGQTGVQLMNRLFPWIPWRLSIDITMLSFAFSVPLIIMFYHEIFPRKRWQFVKWFYQALGILFAVYVLLTPPNAFSFAVWLYINISFGVIPYLAYHFIRDVIRREKGARMLIPGYILFAVAIINDKLHDFHLINTATLVPYGATVFILSYSLMISIRSSRAHSAVENLSVKLEDKNLKLQESLKTLQENIDLKTELRKRKQTEELARIEAEKSMLEKLRYQLNPHFLFNALTSIRGAILNNAETAREMVSNLAEFCRFTLSRGKEEWLQVKQEIQQIELFLRIEQVRLGNYLDIVVKVDSEIAEKKIPSFLLQPLVENAIKYGKQTSPEFLRIGISAQKADNKMVFEITNTGKWFDQESNSNEKSTGIGIENLKKRLGKHYSENHDFRVKKLENEIVVSLSIPL